MEKVKQTGYGHVDQSLQRALGDHRAEHLDSESQGEPEPLPSTLTQAE